MVLDVLDFAFGADFHHTFTKIDLSWVNGSAVKSITRETRMKLNMTLPQIERLLGYGIP